MIDQNRFVVVVQLHISGIELKVLQNLIKTQLLKGEDLPTWGGLK